MNVTLINFTLGILLILPFSAEAQKPSRRALIEQGEQSLQQKAQQHRLNAAEAAELHLEEKVIPVLGYSFHYPEDWEVVIRSDTHTSTNRADIIDGDYVEVADEQYKEGHAFYIYSELTDEPATMEDVWEIWNDIKRQPDHDNVYEYSHLVYLRELEDVEEHETVFVGKEALEIEYTFNNWSKHWKDSVLMFPWGKRVYTIKYRAELGHEERFHAAYLALLDSFVFHTPEPQFSVRQNDLFTDLPNNHPNREAIERLRDLGIVGGYSDGSFKPDATINRAEFIKIMTSDPLIPDEVVEKCSKTSFPDVPADSWFSPNVCVAKFLGMIEGYPDGTFRPEQTISFVEAAKIIASYFEEEIPTDGTWYKPFVAVLENRKAIPVSIRSLSAPITRGEMSEMIRRLYDNVEGESQSLEYLEIDASLLKP